MGLFLASDGAGGLPWRPDDTAAGVEPRWAVLECVVPGDCAAATRMHAQSNPSLASLMLGSFDSLLVNWPTFISNFEIDV